MPEPVAVMSIPPHLRKRYEHEETVREVFNRWAREGRTKQMAKNNRRLAEQVLERLNLVEEDRVLDIGCGDGWTAELLSARCARGTVVGIDISDEMIDRARRRSADSGNQLFQVASAEEIPWAEDYFSRVVSIESAYYWHSPETAAREIFRVTGFGGRFALLMSFYRENPHTAHWDELFDVPLHHNSAAEWKELFELFAFQDVRTEQLPDDTPLPWLFRAGEFWTSKRQRRAFQETGALLVTGVKPEAPPPGPVEPYREPFPIVE